MLLEQPLARAAEFQAGHPAIRSVQGGSSYIDQARSATGRIHATAPPASSLVCQLGRPRGNKLTVPLVAPDSPSAAPLAGRQVYPASPWARSPAARASTTRATSSSESRG